MDSGSLNQAVLLAAQLQKQSEDSIAEKSTQQLDINLQQVIQDPDLYPLEKVIWTKQDLVNYAMTNELTIPTPWPCKSIKQCLSAIHIAANNTPKEVLPGDSSPKASKKRYLSLLIYLKPIRKKKV